MLQHDLTHFLPSLAFFSSRKLRASPLYQGLRTEIRRVLGSVVRQDWAPPHSPNLPNIRALAWNIERGLRLEGIVTALRHDPRLGADLYLLTELDWGMARTRNRAVPQEIARTLELNYVFAPSYVCLSKGTGPDHRVKADNTLSLHGNALFSRYPLDRAHALDLPNGKDKMRGREKRIGCERVVLARVHHPLGLFWAVCVHLDAHSSQRHRHRQMRLVLDHLEKLSPSLPVLLGGDWNTSTYNSKRASYAILGYCRRVLMGIGRVIRDHYPHPDRWFERSLFRELERRGYRYRDCNEIGKNTLHYHVDNSVPNQNMAEWLPRWCFWFIRWALKRHQNRCSMKLDWFATRGIRPALGRSARVVDGVRDSHGPLSDHDPIRLDFLPLPVSSAGFQDRGAKDLADMGSRSENCPAAERADSSPG